MRHAGQELIWQGRLHMGDEPGIYGDAHYAGLSIDLPLTVNSFATSQHDNNTLVIRGEGVKIYDGYPGHQVTVVQYLETTDPAHWDEHVLEESRMTKDRREVTLEHGVLRPASTMPVYLSVRVRVDTEAPPGRYDDFVIVALELVSRTYYASFGFHR